MELPKRVAALAKTTTAVIFGYIAQVPRELTGALSLTAGPYLGQDRRWIRVSSGEPKATLPPYFPLLSLLFKLLDLFLAEVCSVR